MRKLIFFLIFSALFFLTAKPVFATVTFSLQPASGTININETTPVKIVMDTGEDTTGAISVILSFDSAKLSAGTSLTPGVFSLVLVNTVDNSTGRIRFDAGATTNQAGDGITVATINFSGKAAGTAAINFSQTKAVDAETNQYLATSSTGGSYTVASVGATPSPSPSPGVMPSPSPSPTTAASPSPSPSPTTAASPSPSPSPTTAASPSPTATISPEELPETGILTPTLLFLSSGGILLLFAFLLI